MEKNISESLITNEPSLQNLEKKIEAGLEYFRIAGESLRIIKEQKLYKSEYSTYEEYCQQRWGFSPQYANRLISAENTTKMLESETIGSLLPQSESQVRILSKSKDPSAMWKSTQEKTGKEQPTAKDIEAHMRENEDKDTLDAEIIESSTNDKIHKKEESIKKLMMDLMVLRKEITSENKWGPKPVTQIDDRGKIMANYPSAQSAQRVTGIDKSSIGSVCRGSVRKTAGGYHWEFIALL